MIRAVLSVLLAAALLGASFPAIDAARQDHSETAIRTQLDRVERAATAMLATDDPTDAGARRLVTLRLPAKSWTDAGTESVRIGSASDGSGGRFTWSVDGDTRGVRHLPDVPIRTERDAGVLTLAGPGRHRLVLSLDGTATDPVVTVRTFTRDGGASGAHATVAPIPNRGRRRRVRL